MYNTVLLLVFISLTCNAQDGPIAETVYGTIRGATKTTEAGAIYEMYSGVPFASPPLEDLRFAKPVHAEPWQGIRETVNFANGCIEMARASNTSEDCLYLNVYVPGQNRTGDDLAVMVYVHGGGYYVGTSSTYPGQDMAVHGDLIVITVNYRLGPLGFLSTENDAAPGNYGLWDVKLALEWVRDNIAALGGSPDRVTMFGQSAGGAITSHVMISPETQGLLQRGICISGTSTGLAFGTAIPGSSAETTAILGEVFGCPELNNSLAIVDCLRSEDPYEINIWGQLISLSNASYYYMPVVDGDFIPQHPSVSWNQTAPNDLDLMTGAVINDAAFNVLFSSRNNPNVTRNLARTKESTENVLRGTFEIFPGDFEEIQEALVDQYPGIMDNDTDIRTQSVAHMSTDFMFDHGQHFEASQHSLVSGATYMYEYAYTNSFLAPYIDEEYAWYIAEHSEDLLSIFGEQFYKDYVETILQGTFSEEDRNMSSQVMSYFTNFANTGNPNEGKEVPVTWPQYSVETREFLQFSEETKVLMETGQDLDNYRFWTRDFPPVAFPGGIHSGSTDTVELLREVIEGYLSEVETLQPKNWWGFLQLN